MGEEIPSDEAERPQLTNYFMDKYAELEAGLLKAKQKLIEESKNVKFFIAVTAVCFLFIVLHYTRILTLATWVQVVVWLLGILFLLAFIGTNPAKTKAEVERIESIRRVYLGFPETTDSKPEYFDSLVKINVENLAAYYSLVKVHTSQSFKVSLLISIVGFILIAIGLVTGFNTTEKTIAYISAASGVLIEFISGALFYLYNKTVRQLKEYHDSLIEVQNVLLSFKLIEKTTDEKAKSDMITKMIEYLVQKRQ